MSPSRQTISYQSIYQEIDMFCNLFIFTHHMTSSKRYDWLFIDRVNHMTEKPCLEQI